MYVCAFIYLVHKKTLAQFCDTPLFIYPVAKNNAHNDDNDNNNNRPNNKASDIQGITTRGSDPRKCDVIAHPGLTVSDPTLESFKRVMHVQHAITQSAIVSCVSCLWRQHLGMMRRCAGLTRAADRLRSVNAQEVF